MQRSAAIVGASFGIALLYFGLRNRKKAETVIPDYLQPLVDIVGEDSVKTISNDSTWAELCDRMAEFATIARPELKELLLNVADVVEFQLRIDNKDMEVSFGTPRMYRKYLHAVIESVREMRAVVEVKFASSLDDFDDVAAEIQRTHDDYAANMMLESQSRV